jgi:drug/metabolite transporter (DMT)-like permease
VDDRSTPLREDQVFPSSLYIAFGLVGMISFTVIANIFLKIGAVSPPSAVLLEIANWRTAVGFAAFACSAFFYAWLLKWLPLNVAQSFTAVQFVAIIFASRLVLSEPISTARWLGIALIFAGILVVSWDANSGTEYDAKSIIP